jgi:hypothetical protein
VIGGSLADPAGPADLADEAAAAPPVASMLAATAAIAKNANGRRIMKSTSLAWFVVEDTMPVGSRYLPSSRAFCAANSSSSSTHDHR